MLPYLAQPDVRGHSRCPQRSSVRSVSPLAGGQPAGAHPQKDCRSGAGPPCSVVRMPRQKPRRPVLNVWPSPGTPWPPARRARAFQRKTSQRRIGEVENFECVWGVSEFPQTLTGMHREGAPDAGYPFPGDTGVPNDDGPAQGTCLRGCERLGYDLGADSGGIAWSHGAQRPPAIAHDLFHSRYRAATMVLASTGCATTLDDQRLP